MAKTTASPSGVNRYFAGPSRKTTEVKTQLMASVETNVGTAMPAAPCSVASGSGCPSSVSRRWVFSIVTVESSTRMPTASARPPSVIVLSVSPRKYSATSEVRIASGIEIMTTRVERHEPRNSRIISAVRPAAIAPSRSTPCDRLLHEYRLIEQLLDLEAGRRRRARGLQRIPHRVDDSRASTHCRS